MILTIHRSGLGQIATLGALYNAYTVRFCEGSSLFECRIPETSTTRLLAVITQYVDTANCRADRCRQLGIRDDLKVRRLAFGPVG